MLSASPSSSSRLHSIHNAFFQVPLAVDYTSARLLDSSEEIYLSHLLVHVEVGVICKKLEFSD